MARRRRRKMYDITSRDIDRAYRDVKRQRETTEREREERKNLTSALVRGAAVLGGSVLSGTVQARFGITSLGPIPLDLAGGLGLLALSHYMRGMTGDIVEGAGYGFLASFGAKLGASMGMGWRESAGAATPLRPPVPATMSGVGAGMWDAMPSYNPYAPAYDPNYPVYPAMQQPMPNGYGYGQYGQWDGTGVPQAQVADMFQRGIA